MARAHPAARVSCGAVGGHSRDRHGTGRCDAGRRGRECAVDRQRLCHQWNSRLGGRSCAQPDGRRALGARDRHALHGAPGPPGGRQRVRPVRYVPDRHGFDRRSRPARVPDRRGAVLPGGVQRRRGRGRQRRRAWRRPAQRAAPRRDLPDPHERAVRLQRTRHSVRGLRQGRHAHRRPGPPGQITRLRDQGRPGRDRRDWLDRARRARQLRRRRLQRDRGDGRALSEGPEALPPRRVRHLRRPPRGQRRPAGPRLARLPHSRHGEGRAHREHVRGAGGRRERGPSSGPAAGASLGRLLRRLRCPSPAGGRAQPSRVGRVPDHGTDPGRQRADGSCRRHKRRPPQRPPPRGRARNEPRVRRRDRRRLRLALQP